MTVEEMRKLDGSISYAWIKHEKEISIEELKNFTHEELAAIVNVINDLDKKEEAMRLLKQPDK